MPMRAWTLALLALWAAPAWAEWSFIEKWTDPIDGIEVRSARAVNDAGATLHLYRNPTGRVYALFTLPEDSADLAGAGIVARITPDGFDTKEIEARSDLGRIVEYGLTRGRMLRDRLWHGQGQAPAFGTLRDLLEAPSLSGSFQRVDDSRFDTEWSMDGANLPIAQALGITVDGVPAGAEWEDAASQSLLAAMTACQFPKLDVFCVQKVTTCSNKISQERDIDGFERCVAAPSDP